MNLNKILLFTLTLLTCMQPILGMNNLEQSNKKTVETIEKKKPTCMICYKSLESSANISCIHHKPHTYHHSCVDEFFRENTQAQQQCFVCSKEFNGSIKSARPLADLLAEGVQTVSYGTIGTGILGIIFTLCALGLSEKMDPFTIFTLSVGVLLFGGCLYIILDTLYDCKHISTQRKNRIKKRASHEAGPMALAFGFAIVALGMMAAKMKN